MEAGGVPMARAKVEKETVMSTAIVTDHAMLIRDVSWG